MGEVNLVITLINKVDHRRPARETPFEWMAFRSRADDDQTADTVHTGIPKGIYTLVVIFQGGSSPCPTLIRACIIHCKPYN